MDRFSPPGLFVPTAAALVSALLFSIAYPMSSEGNGGVLRGVLVALAIVFACVAIGTGLDWLIGRIADWVKAFRESYYGPQVRVLEAIKGMTPAQLALAGYYSPFRAEARMAGGNLQWWLHTPGGDIPYGWVGEYLEKCALKYPELIPQHGMPDSLNLEYVRDFTELMVANGLATPAIGRRAAQWKYPLSEVAERLGLGE